MNEALKMALLRSGVPQFEIARQTGLSETKLSRLVRGRLSPSLEEATRLAELLHEHVAHLFPELGEQSVAAMAATLRRSS